MVCLRVLSAIAALRSGPGGSRWLILAMVQVRVKMMML